MGNSDDLLRARPINKANGKSVALYKIPFIWIRNLYNWVLHWADTQYAVPALFLLTFGESSFFPIAPDVLLITLCLSIPQKGFYYAAICSIASLFGGIAGYGIGYYFWEAVGYPIINFYHAQEVFNSVKTAYQNNAFIVVFSAAFTPVPYKIFTIAGGICRIRFWQDFVAGSILGRSTRFFLIAGLFYFFGPSIKQFIDKYFGLLTIAFVIVLIGGFVAIKFIF